MKETNQSLSELWTLLRNKEKSFGLNELTLTERDIFQVILHLQGKANQISLEKILKNCPHPRATFFRSLKKLRLNNFIKVTKNENDARKSFVTVQEKYRL